MKTKVVPKPMSSIDSIFEQVVVNYEKSTMRETYFKEVFLPLFISGEFNNDSASITKWLDIAGSPYHEVNIVDDNGVVLYSVPPLFERNSLDASNSDPSRVSMIHVVATVSQLNNIHPSQAENYLKKQFKARGYDSENSEIAKKNIDQWISILTRYGYLKSQEVKKENKPVGLEFSDDDDLNC